MKSIGYTDNPIKSQMDDTFDVGAYIEGLCEFILTCSTPMTIAIQGDWGSGKTSMMNMVRDRLEGKVVPAWFNTWKYSQFDLQDRLVFSMMTHLMKELSADDERLRELKTTFGNLLKLAAVGVVGMASETSAVQLGDALSRSDPTVEIDKIRTAFQKSIDDRIRVTKMDRAVFFIDDLDRLNPAKAVEILEVMKQFLDCDHCVFVLAIDFDVIAQGLKMKYGESMSESKSRSFFDKIIQLPFKMPVAQYNISRFLRGMLEQMDLAGITEEDIKEFEILIQTSTGFNPRSLKRLFNTFQLLNSVMGRQRQDKTSVKKDIKQQKIIFAILCMQLTYEGLYSYTMQNVHDLRKLFRDDFEEERKNDKETYTKLSLGLDNAMFKRMLEFRGAFLNCIQLDSNDELSDEEIENLRRLLVVSTITATGNMETGDSNRNYGVRRENRRLASEVNRILCTRFGYADRTLRVYQSERDKSGVIPTTASGYHYGDIPDNPPWYFNYDIKHDMAKRIFSLGLQVAVHKSFADELTATLCKRLDIKVLRIERRGNYQFHCILAEVDEFEGGFEDYRDRSVGLMVPLLEKLLLNRGDPQ
jgi:hypothetical protein